MIEPNPRPRPRLGLGYMHGSHKGPNPPAACRGCGRPMRMGTFRDGYDRSTGAAVIRQKADCSMPLWRRIVAFWVFHDHAVQDDFNDWPWV